MDPAARVAIAAAAAGDGSGVGGQINNASPPASPLGAFRSLPPQIWPAIARHLAAADVFRLAAASGGLRAALLPCSGLFRGLCLRDLNWLPVIDASATEEAGVGSGSGAAAASADAAARQALAACGALRQALRRHCLRPRPLRPPPWAAKCGAGPRGMQQCSCRCGCSGSSSDSSAALRLSASAVAALMLGYEHADACVIGQPGSQQPRGSGSQGTAAVAHVLRIFWCKQLVAELRCHHGAASSSKADLEGASGGALMHRDAGEAHSVEVWASPALAASRSCCCRLLPITAPAGANSVMSEIAPSAGWLTVLRDWPAVGRLLAAAIRANAARAANVGRVAVITLDQMQQQAPYLNTLVGLGCPLADFTGESPHGSGSCAAGSAGSIAGEWRAPWDREPDAAAAALKENISALPASYPDLQAVFLPALLPRGRRPVSHTPGCRVLAPRLLGLLVPVLSELRDAMPVLRHLRHAVLVCRSGDQLETMRALAASTIDRATASEADDADV